MNREGRERKRGRCRIENERMMGLRVEEDMENTGRN